MKKGVLISFEGMDKVGKSTQVDRLIEHLRANGIEPVAIREPGSTEVSEKIRAILADRNMVGKISSLTEFFLYSASRAQLVVESIKPAMSKGEVIITDRYYDSSTAYQGYGRGLDLDFIIDVNMKTTEGMVPDLTVLMVIEGSSIDSKEGVKRFGPDLFDDRLEREFIDFRTKVQNGYLTIAEKEPERFLVIDSSRTIAQIGKTIAARVDELLKDRDRPQE
ncbi:MAG: dTMP kinase [candidate division Zixibacteria bacterium]